MKEADWNLEQFLREDYILHPSENEAKLLDWLYTLHSWDLEIFEYLTAPERKTLKERIGSVIIGKSNEIQLNSEELWALLTVCPITFKWGYDDDFGKTLKTKLYYLLLTSNDSPPEEGQEEKTNTSEKPSQTDFLE